MKVHMGTTGKSRIALEILAYLIEHPNAQDTLEGIVEWWLLEQQMQQRTAQAKAALAELVTEGLIVEHQGEDTRLHYRMNRYKHEEIQQLLTQQSG